MSVGRGRTTASISEAEFAYPGDPGAGQPSGTPGLAGHATTEPRPAWIHRKPAILAACIAVGAVLPFLRSAWDAEGPVQETVENLGLALILLAIAGRCWSTLYIGGRKSRELVRRGPFSIVRNPLYMFSFVGAFGMGACSGSVVIATAFLALAVVLFSPVVAREEMVLAERFGDGFRDYRASVPRFVPSLRLWHDPGSLEIEPRLVVRTFLDGLPFILAMPLFELIGEWQLRGGVAVLFILP